MIKLDIARRIAFSMLNKPYCWGGNDPIKGFDCSGFVIEILKSVGLLPAKGDWTAKGLYDKFKDYIISEDCISEGCLIFWENSEGVVNHVEYALTSKLSIGARGCSSVVDIGKAIEQDAYIKIRPIKDRGRKIHAVINLFCC